MTKRDMLINYVAGQECRIAVLEDGRLDELYQERASAESHVGNIYKGRIVNVEPAIQAAFVDFGLERNGFLHVSDLHPMYFPGQAREERELVGKKTPRRDRPPIQKSLRRGQEVLVQVLKEGIGTKGPTLTSYLSIPGRFIVMMPNMERLGVSRKIEDDEARRATRKALDELKPPEGFGFIIRTAGVGRPKLDLKRDLAYLQRLWKAIERRMAELPGPGELYTESDLVIRTLRDVFSSDIQRIIVDDPGAARRAAEFLSVASPRAGANVLVYSDKVPLFHRFDVERQIETIHSRVVALPSGGSLVVDSTEALVAIDVNSGKMREHHDAETTAYKTNVEAVDEICRQLRLRDLGGVIVNDLIDMRHASHRRSIEQRMRDNLKHDRARTRILSISQFGIMEMTRQRMRPSLKKSIYAECRHCQGMGHVKSAESVVLDVMRRLALATHHAKVTRVELTVGPEVAFQLLNRWREQLVEMEQQCGKPIMVRVHDAGPVDYIALAAFDSRGSAVDAEKLANMGEVKFEPTRVLIDVGDLSDEELDELSEPTVDEETESEVEAEAAMAGDDHGDGAQRQPAAAPEAAGKPRRRRRRRRGGRGRKGDAAGDGDKTAAAAGEPSRAAASGDDGDGERDDDGDGRGQVGAASAESAENPAGESAAKPRRRRRRGGRGRGKAAKPATAAADRPDDEPAADDEDKPGDAARSGDSAGAAAPKKKRRRRRRKKSTAKSEGGAKGDAGGDSGDAGAGSGGSGGAGPLKRAAPDSSGPSEPSE